MMIHTLFIFKILYIWQLNILWINHLQILLINIADLLRTKIDELTLEAAYKGSKASLLQPSNIFPANRLPRNSTDIDNMADDNPDKQGFRLAQTAELASIVAMGTWSQDEVLPDNISNKLSYFLLF